MDCRIFLHDLECRSWASFIYDHLLLTYGYHSSCFRWTTSALALKLGLEVRQISGAISMMIRLVLTSGAAAQPTRDSMDPLSFAHHFLVSSSAIRFLLRPLSLCVSLPLPVSYTCVEFAIFRVSGYKQNKYNFGYLNHSS